MTANPIVQVSLAEWPPFSVLNLAFAYRWMISPRYANAEELGSLCEWSALPFLLAAFGCPRT